MSGLFQTISDMANHSTIGKRNEIRNEKHIHNNGLHHHHQADGGVSAAPIVDTSISQTLGHLTDRSTIYQHHEHHHQEMHHNNNPTTEEYHKQYNMMTPSTIHHHDTIGETLTQMSTESSIYDRNVRRDQFLHSH